MHHEVLALQNHVQSILSAGWIKAEVLLAQPICKVMHTELSLFPRERARSILTHHFDCVVRSGCAARVVQVRDADDTSAPQSRMTVHQHTLSFGYEGVDLLTNHEDLAIARYHMVFPVVVEKRDPCIIEEFRVVAEAYSFGDQALPTVRVFARLLQIENCAYIQCL